MKAMRGIRTEEEAACYTVSAETRLTYAAQYVMLVGFLAVMCHELYQALPGA
jgi:hypothetical protein